MSDILVLGGERLSREKEVALNELLKRHAGDVDGIPFYKISWAADDNRSLARNHQVYCPKTNPFDWDCGCPLAEPDKLPLCFSEHQQSYHLLSWEPPNMGMMMLESQTKEDYSRGTYSCILHFVDQATGKPFDPTGVIVEKMIPVLSELRVSDQAARKGLDAVVNRERQKRIDAAHERQQRKDKEYDNFATALLDDAAPALEGQPFVGHGKKQRQSSDMTLTDLKNEREQ